MILDLRGLGFALLAAVVAAVALAIFLARRLELRRAADRTPGAATRQVLASAPYGWLVLNGPDSYSYANPYARRLLELDAPTGSLPDEQWCALLDEDRHAVLVEVAPGGRYRSVPLVHKRFCSWWVTAAEDVTLVFLLDTTPQHRSEEASRTLLNGLSHELRTPLATLLTHLEMLGLPGVTTETKAQSVELMKLEARRMARLVNNMLELGRLDANADIERRPIDLLAVVDEAIAQVRPRAEETGIELTLEVATPLPLAVGDADRLKQVFLNLLDNAVKYSRPGDRVTASLRPERDGIRGAVRDTGPGIPAQHLPHLTERFYRAAPQAMEGSGLGLALVEEILARHQSRLEIESHTEGADTGTCVQFWLPALPDEEATE